MHFVQFCLCRSSPRISSPMFVATTCTLIVFWSHITFPAVGSLTLIYCLLHIFLLFPFAHFSDRDVEKHRRCAPFASAGCLLGMLSRYIFLFSLFSHPQVQRVRNHRFCIPSVSLLFSFRLLECCVYEFDFLGHIQIVHKNVFVGMHCGSGLGYVSFSGSIG